MKKMKNRFCYFDFDANNFCCNFVVDYFPSFDLFLTLTILTSRSMLTKTMKTQPWRRWWRLAGSGGRPIGKVVVRGSCLLNSAWPAGAGLHQTHAGLAASFMQVDVVGAGDPAGGADGLTAAIASEFAVISANALAVTTGRSTPFLTSWRSSHVLSSVAMGAPTISVSCLLLDPLPLPPGISFILGNEVIDVRDLVGELAEVVPLPNCKILDDSCVPLFLVPDDFSEEFKTGNGFG